MRKLFAWPTMAKLAEKICADGGIQLADIKWGNFPDKWPDLFVEDWSRHAGDEVYFLASFHEPADVIPQYLVMGALHAAGIDSLTVILPNFSVGTMDRVSTLGQIANAMGMARLISSIPPAFGKAKIRFITYDIHALQEQFYFDSNRVYADLRSAVPMLIRRLGKLAEPVSICFPDEGAEKRFGNFFAKDKFPIIVCSKVRDGTKRIVTVKEGETNGAHAVIVDDLILSGGTIHECRAALLAKGAAKVSVFATHPVMPQYAFKKFLASDYAHVWVTDSVPETAQYLNNPPFEVLSLAHEIRGAIFR